MKLRRRVEKCRKHIIRKLR